MMYCYFHWMGNGVCEPECNNEHNFYDMGDCCLPTAVTGPDRFCEDHENRNITWGNHCLFMSAVYFEWSPASRGRSSEARTTVGRNEYIKCQIFKKCDETCTPILLEGPPMAQDILFFSAETCTLLRPKLPQVLEDLLWPQIFCFLVPKHVLYCVQNCHKS